MAERLREERVKAIIQPMLAGLDLPDTPEDDRRFSLDLGLVKRIPLGRMTIANPIYQEVIPRVLSQGSQDSLTQIQPTWLNTDK
ncbi:hypothetical protein BCV63_01485 [Cylindrospermopsis raciborskii CS-508]|nr:hypothetical protein BCV63_01485 [Cylindrospermopsis raciborskii CS-508]